MRRHSYYSINVGATRKGKFQMWMIVVAIILLAVGHFTFRFDYKGGSHKIYPTAVDTDLWGNYQVYFRSSPLTQDKEESFYYIDKSRSDIANTIKDCIVKNQSIVIYYDRYIGFKGFTAPAESPIVKVDIVQNQ